MTGRVDQVKFVNLPVERVINRDGPGLDRDSALAFQIHVIEQLLAELAMRNRSRLEQELIGERALTMIDVSHDRKIANELGIENHVFGSRGLCLILTA